MLTDAPIEGLEKVNIYFTEVDEQHLTTLTLDFDAQASIVSLGNGDFLLKPVVLMTGNNTSSQP